MALVQPQQQRAAGVQRNRQRLERLEDVQKR